MVWVWPLPLRKVLVFLPASKRAQQENQNLINNAYQQDYQAGWDAVNETNSLKIQWLIDKIVSLRIRTKELESENLDLKKKVYFLKK